MAEKMVDQIEVTERVGRTGGERSADATSSLLDRMVALGKDASRRENLWHRSARFALKSAPSHPHA